MLDAQIFQLSESLEQRIEMEKKIMSLEIQTAIISSASTLFGVLIGSIVSYKIARQQFRSTVLCGNRQAWINELRLNVAEFITECDSINQTILFAATSTKLVKSDLETMPDSFKKCELLIQKCKLLINPDENNHVNLIVSMEKLAEITFDHEKILSDKQGTLITKSAMQEQITKLAQIILKHEWTIVKKGN